MSKIISKELIEKAFKIILKRAKEYNPIYYGQLYEELKLNHASLEDRMIGAEILEEVNEKSGKNYMLTAFVVSKSGNGPYEGFYTLAVELGRIKNGLSDDEKDRFWIAEMKKVHEKFKMIKEEI